MSVVWSALLGAVVCAGSVRALLPWLRRVARQPIREDAPPRHREKAGTPTLGGLALLAGALGSVLGAGPWTPAVGVAAAATVAYGAVGLLDDWLSLRRGSNLGLRAREKLALQVPVAVGVGWYAARTSPQGTALELPWGAWDMGWGYVVFAALFLVAFANGVNLTDGLDGLAAGCVAVTLGAYAVVALRAGQPELATFAAAVAGSCLGFLWFNAHPAQVIMGDVGSQALGAAVGTLALLTRTEVLAVLVGLVFVVEAGSVVLQVGYFKLTRGRRVFRSSPLHHHFELVGWEEPKIVTRAWLVACLAALAGLGLWR